MMLFFVDVLSLLFFVGFFFCCSVLFCLGFWDYYFQIDIYE